MARRQPGNDLNRGECRFLHTDLLSLNQADSINRNLVNGRAILVKGGAFMLPLARTKFMASSRFGKSSDRLNVATSKRRKMKRGQECPAQQESANLNEDFKGRWDSR